MKKSDITASLVIIITCVLLVVFLGLRSIGGDGIAPSYLFLAGREPITCKKADSPDDDRRYTYSFEADFNDICSKADDELIPEGFVGQTFDIENLSGSEPLCRMYWPPRSWFSHRLTWIYIYNNRQSIKFPNSKYNAVADKDGWVTVEVVYGKDWWWPF
ncbi:MAG: hypothetical protein JXA81_00105 [Sedimentisphaerales bacterium]|nr:hypothetical protein [Sedimentisphaerales bacterium]